MIDQTNEWVVTNLPNLSEMKTHQEQLGAEIERLKYERDRLTDPIRLLDRVDRVCDGVAISDDEYTTIYGGPNRNIGQVAGTRGATVYVNANDRKHWGVTVSDRCPQYRDSWLGAHHTYDDAVEMAMAWVLRGEKS